MHKCRLFAITAGVMTFIVCLLLAIESLAQDEPTPIAVHRISIWEARRSAIPDWAQISRVNVTIDSIEFDYRKRPNQPAQRMKIDLQTMPEIEVDCGKDNCHLAAKSVRLSKDSPLEIILQLTFSDAGPDPAHPLHSCVTTMCKELAQGYVGALNQLREFAMNPNEPIRRFHELAAQWRSQATKPPLPEAIRIQQLLAEDDVKNNNPYKALHDYEVGIEVYPVWPEGNFNAALIDAQAGLYKDAVEHMQAYLELVPEAPDAQAARDHILLWKAKEIEAR